MNWYELLGVVLGSGGAIVAAVTGFFTYLQKRSEQKTSSELNDIRKNTEGIAKLEQKMESEINEIKSTLYEYADYIDTAREIDCIVFKNDIRNEINRYITKGSMTFIEREHLEKMSDIYLNKLNENGDVKHLIETCQLLPIKESE